MGRTWSAPSSHDSRLLICTGPSGGPAFDETTLELVDGAKVLELVFHKNDLALTIGKRETTTIMPAGRRDNPDFAPIEREASQTPITFTVSADEVIYGDPDRVSVEDLVLLEWRLSERGWYSAAAAGSCGDFPVWDVLIQSWQCERLVYSYGLPGCKLAGNKTFGLPNNTFSISGECPRNLPLKRNHLIP